ncbi:MAG: outer membrane protein assembly factor BamE, partial [Deltaproteobacteria bacterium]|nr:outer membrane protein assembly factor BamE [Deltaproteobacteria bacterium]
DDVGKIVPDALGNTSLMYRQDVQQGNVVTQEMVDKLRPGMNKRQVKYILGTPLLVDTFHQNRWDYIYTMREGGAPSEQEQLFLFFEDDKLIRVGGDFRPKVSDNPLGEGKETVFSVPDHNKKEKGFFMSTLESMGVDTEEQESKPSAAGLGKDDQLPEMGEEERTYDSDDIEDLPPPPAQEEKGFF